MLQNDPHKIDVLGGVSERSIAGEYMYEATHTNITSGYGGPLFTPWSQLRDGREEPVTGYKASPIRYADAMTESLTFWVEVGEEDGRLSAGLVCTLPLTDRQIGAIAKFVSAARGGELSAEFHEKWLREVLFDKMPAAIASKVSSSTPLVPPN